MTTSSAIDHALGWSFGTAYSGKIIEMLLRLGATIGTRILDIFAEAFRMFSWMNTHYRFFGKNYVPWIKMG